MRAFISPCTHTYVRQAEPLVTDPGSKLLTTPAPCWREYSERKPRIHQAHLYALMQHIVVDLEEPRSLRPTIGWPASGAMRNPAYGLRRIPLPRTRVHKG